MTIDIISKKVECLQHKFKQDDPFRLCADLGIMVALEPMGTYAGACKGFFLSQSRKRIVTINSDLPKHLHRIIAAHELGHAILHRGSRGVTAFHDFALFDTTDQKEYEANLFAAEFLMTDRDVLERLNADVSFFNAAALLRVPPELLDFKFRVLKRKGYKVVDPPITSTGAFMKDMELGVSDGESC